MIIIVQGSRNFNDYEIFTRAMGVAMSGLKDDRVTIWSAGPHKVNNFSIAFSNTVENYLKNKGIRIRSQKVTPQYAVSNVESADYVVYLCTPKESPKTALTAAAELSEIETAVFKY